MPTGHGARVVIALNTCTTVLINSIEIHRPLVRATRIFFFASSQPRRLLRLLAAIARREAALFTFGPRWRHGRFVILIITNVFFVVFVLLVGCLGLILVIVNLGLEDSHPCWRPYEHGLRYIRR